jgi:hypothetical protein
MTGRWVNATVDLRGCRHNTLQVFTAAFPKPGNDALGVVEAFESVEKRHPRKAIVFG